MVEDIEFILKIMYIGFYCFCVKQLPINRIPLLSICYFLDEQVHKIVFSFDILIDDMK